MLRLQNISKKFGRQPALKKINFEIAAGSITGLLGPNGAGKTTAMRIIAGVISADQGKILFRQQRVNPLESNFRKNLGYLPENNPLYPFLTPWEYLNFIGQIRQITNRRRQIKKLATGLLFKDRLSQPIGQLSKGYRQRVGLAATLLGHPPLLILDEPISGLDPNQQRLVRDFIRRLKTTVLFSSHILAEVQEICDRVVIINRGRIVAQGPIREFLHKPNLKLTLEGAKIDYLKKAFAKKGIKIIWRKQQGKALELELAMDGNINELRKTVWNLVRQHSNWQLYQLETSRQTLDKIFQELTET